MVEKQVAILRAMECAQKAARKAGAILLEGFGSCMSYRLKEGNQNIVTSYDLASEQAIIETIISDFPDSLFIAEETHKLTHPIKDDCLTWIIDPLDGTVNYAHNIPFFAVSIAFMQRGKLLGGVVFDPCRNELFNATESGGAYCQDKPISVSTNQTFDTALLATGFSYTAYENRKQEIDRFAKVIAAKGSVRRLGSAALDLAYIASGRFDLFWEEDLQIWDIAAGMLLVKEAGGALSKYDGTPLTITDYPNVLASNSLLHQKALEVFASLKKTENL